MPQNSDCTHASTNLIFSLASLGAPMCVHCIARFVLRRRVAAPDALVRLRFGFSTAVTVGTAAATVVGTTANAAIVAGNDVNVVGNDTTGTTVVGADNVGNDTTGG